jgi:hypothetical protein
VDLEVQVLLDLLVLPDQVEAQLVQQVLLELEDLLALVDLEVQVLLDLQVLRDQVAAQLVQQVLLDL